MGLPAIPFTCGDQGCPPPFPSTDSLPVARREAQPTVLVIDDEHIIADTIAHILHLSGFKAEPVYSGRAALEMIGELRPDVVITDVVMPELDGIETAKRLMATCPSAKILLLSGQAATADMIKQARTEGFQFELLAKPLHPDDLLAALRRLGF